MGQLSPHFTTREFACPCCGLAGPVSRRLLDVLEAARRAARERPLRIVSGVRCVPYNRRVGGHPRSQHVFGRAADVPRGYLDVEGWLRAGAVGVGLRRGHVIHVDVTPGVRAFIFNE